MNKIKEKLKKIFFTDEDEVQGDDFTTKREMFYFAGMMVGVFVSIFAILFTVITISMCKDLVGMVQADKAEINKLEDLNNYYSGEAVRYKMMYEDLYDIYVFPQEQEEAGVYNDLSRKTLFSKIYYGGILLRTSMFY